MPRRPIAIAVTLAASLAAASDSRAEEGPSAPGAPPEASCRGAEGPYQAAVRALAARRSALAARWSGAARLDRREAARERAVVAELAADAIVAGVRELAGHWLGVRWGLGRPQATTPACGKINCGTFVGTVLRDAGFRVDVARLQRQPSQLIIRSFVGASRIRRWSTAPMERFLADVRRMGPGLFIIGLDFHVGLLIQTEDDLRFLHASYVTGTVIDEAAATAPPIVESRYRVVGKLLDRPNLRDWLEGRGIAVKGDW